ncbi:hypothetical protein BH11ACT3_BH11ACT3_13190 [soil metagenome]
MSDTVVTVRPRRSLLTSAFLSILLGMIPVFGVLYWFAIDRGTWPLVLVVHVIVVIASAASLLRQLTVHSAVTSTELVGRGIFSPLIRVSLTKIATVHLIATYSGSSPDTVTQLLVSDEEGHRLFRMRGNFWHRGDLEAIAAALPVPATVLKEPMSMDEFFRTYPGSAYWFEHRPLLRVGVFAVIVVGALAVTAWAMTVVGIPLVP